MTNVYHRSREEVVSSELVRKIQNSDIASAGIFLLEELEENKQFNYQIDSLVLGEREIEDAQKQKFGLIYGKHKKELKRKDSKRSVKSANTQKISESEHSSDTIQVAENTYKRKSWWFKKKASVSRSQHTIIINDYQPNEAKPMTVKGKIRKFFKNLF